MSEKIRFRTMWMFPRNIRYIAPWKLVQISTLLNAASGAISDQGYQDQLYDELENLGLKAKKNPYGVVNAGGFRTYLAQLACLGLFWKDSESDSYETTYAGELFIDAQEPSKILRCQLLRMQFPSAYGYGHNVAMSPEVKVKPFIFIYNLFKDPALGGHLSSDDMGVAVVYGRTFSDHARVVEKILKLRQTRSFASIIDSVDDLRTPKRFHPENPELDMLRGIEDARTIGNTAKNYMLASGLISVCEITGDFEMNPDPRILSEIQPWLAEGSQLDKVDSDHLEAWQQRFGRYDKTKAVRSLSKKSPVNGFASMVRVRLFAAAEASPFIFDLSAFLTEEAKRWGCPVNDVALAIAPFKSRIRTAERDTVMKAAASGGRESIVLEKAITAILQQLGFDGSEHIGQKKSPRKGGYPDIRILRKAASTCGFGDTKATMNYDFALGDTEKLGSYYKDCWAEFPDQRKSTFFLYIAGGFGLRSTKSITQKLSQASASYGCPVSAITVDALLDLVEKPQKPDVALLSSAFESGRLYTSSEELYL